MLYYTIISAMIILFVALNWDNQGASDKLTKFILVLLSLWGFVLALRLEGLLVKLPHH